MPELPRIRIRSDPMVYGHQGGHLADDNVRPGGLSFGQAPRYVQDGSSAVGRFDAQHVVVTAPATPGNELRVSHDLKRTPTRAVVVNCDTAGIAVYRGTTEWNDQEVWLRFTGTGSEVVTVELA